MILNAKKIEKKIRYLESQISKYEELLDEANKRKLIKCEHCGKRTRLGDLIYIQTHWYEEPHGCTGGACWHKGEGQYKCPKCNELNRLIFEREQIVDLKYCFKKIEDDYR